jgi:NitT/TauT family transport system ATP-binding protein
MIQINNLTKKFKKNNESIVILNKINFEINKSEFVCIFGPNGCGKSTLLNIIGGIEKPTIGNLKINEDGRVTRIGYVFQNPDDTMLPWKTVLENITFGLESQNIKSNKKKIIAENLLKIVNLYKVRDLYFCYLSGGMKQLVAICRALIFKPDILLLDEPFGSLDYFTTKRMWSLLIRLWKKFKITILFVSHDIDEAIFLSDKVIVLSNKPTYVKEIINVNLTRPRNFDSLKNNYFFKVRNKILDIIKYEK